MSDGGPFLVYKWPSSLCVSRDERDKGALWGHFYKGANSIHEGSPFMT